MRPVWEDRRVRRGLEAQLELRRRRLAEGDRPVGWKVAFGAPQAMELLGLDAPLVGFLTSRALVDPSGSYSIAGWRKPALEAEIAVHIGHDLGAGASREDTEAAIVGLGPAIELADLDRPLDDLEAVLAENIFQRGVILGPPDSGRAGGRVEGIRARTVCDGVELGSTGDPTALTGELVGVIAHVAELLTAFGETLRAGEVVIAGAVLPHVWPEPGQHVEVEIEPLGRLEISFEPA
ncbi:MAG TPA: fumarylacetoacetate hydrolase family protein [Gaiellaceae bacterium]|nr:fumarylacetoacetate hydrolase family protein [Gaiellaceae bacterium]